MTLQWDGRTFNELFKDEEFFMIADAEKSINGFPLEPSFMKITNYTKMVSPTTQLFPFYRWHDIVYGNILRLINPINFLETGCVDKHYLFPVRRFLPEIRIIKSNGVYYTDKIHLDKPILISDHECWNNSDVYNNYGAHIYFAKDQSDEMIWNAVKQMPISIIFVKNSTTELWLKALTEISAVINYLSFAPKDILIYQKALSIADADQTIKLRKIIPLDFQEKLFNEFTEECLSNNFISGFEFEKDNPKSSWILLISPDMKANGQTVHDGRNIWDGSVTDEGTGFWLCNIDKMILFLNKWNPDCKDYAPFCTNNIIFPFSHYSFVTIDREAFVVANKKDMKGLYFTDIIHLHRINPINLFPLWNSVTMRPKLNDYLENHGYLLRYFIAKSTLKQQITAAGESPFIVLFKRCFDARVYHEAARSFRNKYELMYHPNPTKALLDNYLVKFRTNQLPEPMKFESTPIIVMNNCST